MCQELEEKQGQGAKYEKIDSSIQGKKCSGIIVMHKESNV